MRIKTFTGRSIDELLPQIREELGASAVVLAQREKVVGGIGGFFGTKMIEVTAADRMPDDDALVDMDDQVADGTLVGVGADLAAAATSSGDPVQDALADRFRGAMRMGREGGLDVTDTWDPAQDAELAHEYGRVLEHAASSGFAELDVPVVQQTAAPVVAPQQPLSDPMQQARALADRTHQNVEATTRRADAGYGAAQPAAAGTYAPPAALPQAAPQPAAHTFQASVVDAPQHLPMTQPAAVAAPATPQQQADALLMGDLALTQPSMASPQMQHAVASAIDLVDLRAIAALRSAVDASRRIEDGWRADAGPELSDALTTLARAGVDDDVAASIATTVLRHRQPFAPTTPVQQLVHDVVEETLDVRTGFHKPSDRAHQLALVGASSAGKTTVAAKIAQAYGTSGMRVGVIVVLPDDPTAAVVQDPRLVALGAEVRYVTTPAQASAAADVMREHDLVVIDTPGTTYLDQHTFHHVDSCLRAIGVDDVHVVVPLSTSSREAAHLVDAFSPLGANRMVVSRLDESRYAGQLLNLGFRLGLPMTFLSDGPRIPDDLRAASAREIAERILAPATGSYES